MSIAQAHRKARRLFPDDGELLEHLSERLGRDVKQEELDALREGFLSDIQRAYLNLVGYYYGVYPARKGFIPKAQE